VATTGGLIMIEISNEYFCMVGPNDDVCIAFPPGLPGCAMCKHLHRKWPTPIQFKNEYKKSPEGMTYYELNDDGYWDVHLNYSDYHSYLNPVVIACTPFFNPPSNWVPNNKKTCHDI